MKLTSRDDASSSRDDASSSRDSQREISPGCSLGHFHKQLASKGGAEKRKPGRESSNCEKTDLRGYPTTITVKPMENMGRRCPHPARIEINSVFSSKKLQNSLENHKIEREHRARSLATSPSLRAKRKMTGYMFQSRGKVWG